MELRGKYRVPLGRRARVSLAKEVIEKYQLSKGHCPQKFGLGMKEIWEIDPAKHREGTVTHTMGWPLGSQRRRWKSFIYHLDNNQVYVGFVVHLNYANPHLYPYMEFQRFKHHPMVAELLKGRQTHRLRCPRDQRGRLAVDPENGRAGRGTSGMLGGSGERAADQGQP